jgi:hypothetical protein
MSTTESKDRERRWRKLVKEWRASGESAAGFAKRHGFSSSSLRYWEGRLHLDAEGAEPRSAVKSDGPSLVRLIPRRGAEGPGRDQPSVVIDVGGAMVRVLPGFDATLLVEVVRVLREASS